MRNPRHFASNTQGRPSTQTEGQARRRRGEYVEPGVAHLTWTTVRNGLPEGKPYLRAPEEDVEAAEAERAWNQVARIQAQLRGEPVPEFIAHPWTKGACLGCGYQMRCHCPSPEATS